MFVRRGHLLSFSCFWGRCGGFPTPQKGVRLRPARKTIIEKSQLREAQTRGKAFPYQKMDKLQLQKQGSPFYKQIYYISKSPQSKSYLLLPSSNKQIKSITLPEPNLDNCKQRFGHADVFWTDLK